MAITSADISTYLSGGAANADSDLSLGGAKSSVEWAGGTLHDLFDVVTGDENAASDDEYRAVYVQNDHATLTWENVVVWLSGPRFTAEADDDIFTSTAHGFTDGMAVRVAAELTGDTLPTGVAADTTYFIRDATANTYKLAASAGGVAIDLTADGSGATRKFFGVAEAIALADEAVSTTIETIADEDTAPVGPAFSTPVTKATGLSIGNLAPGAYKGIWIRRTAANSAAFDSDGLTLRFAGDTAA